MPRAPAEARQPTRGSGAVRREAAAAVAPRSHDAGRRADVIAGPRAHPRDASGSRRFRRRHAPRRHNSMRRALSAGPRARATTRRLPARCAGRAGAGCSPRSAGVIVIAGAALFVLLSRGEVSALDATRLTVDPIPVAAAPVGLVAAGRDAVGAHDGREVGSVRPIEDDKAGEELTLDDEAYSLAGTGARPVGDHRGRDGTDRPRGAAGPRGAGRPRGGQRQRDRRRRRRAVGDRHDRQQP